MIDIKLQMQCFALIGKTRKLINTWMEKGDKSPGSVQAMRIRLEKLISEIDDYIDGNDDIADT